MRYLNTFTFPSENQEHSFFMKNQRTCYDTFYPFQALRGHHLGQITFEPLTIFYGGNGSGKSTALNIIAEKMEMRRDSVFNRSNFYGDYLRLCQADSSSEAASESRIITSDDVFDYLLNIRNLNEGIDQKREEIFKDYIDTKYADFQMKSIADYERLKKMNKTRSKTQSRYVRSELMDNIREYSNGESAFQYFTEKIGEAGLYLLDEPENSLSSKRQLELGEFITDSVRFFGCQFIMATHSPFLLSLRGAKIIDLDEKPAQVKHWTHLENIRLYYHFFQKHSSAFSEEQP